MSYSRPFRLRLLDAVTNCLRSITPDNGYQSDLSASVFRGRLVFGDNDPLPMVSILETPIPLDSLPTPAGGKVQRGDFDLLIQGFAVDDKEHPTDNGYILLADVKKALVLEREKTTQISMSGGPNAFGMGKAVSDIDIGFGTVRPADETSATTYFWLRVTIKITEDISKPFD